MTDLSSAYWNNRYLNNDFVWDIGCVSPPLKMYTDQLFNKKIKILIPGAGNAYEADYLFENGFSQVYVLDFAAQPLQTIRQRQPLFPVLQLLEQDFFEHQGQYDLILEQTFFCALDPALRKNYASHMHQLLKPGGTLAGVLFNDTLNVAGPPFAGSKEEYVQLFEPLFEIKVMELCYNSIKPRQNRELFMVLKKR
jgi:methyl halide transferase